MSIEIANIKKSFGRTQVLNDISLDIPSGQMVALLGPSGSGKTTLLRIIAGLEHQTSGHIRFHGTDVSRMHARDRKVGFVFQHYALFRHMTVFDNIAFGLTVLPRRERPNAAAIKAKVTKLLEMVQLAHLADRYPAQLSGGQKQRVALARALAVEPQILLLDEPFGALDAQVRKELRRWLRQLHEELKFTSVFVTHDQEEAMEVADRVVVMSQGNIEQPMRLNACGVSRPPASCWSSWGSESSAGGYPRRTVPRWRPPLAVRLYPGIPGAGGSVPASVGSGHQPPNQPGFAAAGAGPGGQSERTLHPISRPASGVV
jgi:sulfate transport system ATP-binding protein